MRATIDFEAMQADVTGINSIICTVTAKTVGPTGVAMGRGMTIGDCKPLEKHEGREVGLQQQSPSTGFSRNE
jgi:hypothetical protein